MHVHDQILKYMYDETAYLHAAFRADVIYSSSCKFHAGITHDMDHFMKFHLVANIILKKHTTCSYISTSR